MSDGKGRDVDLSSAAIDRRLREASQLLKLCFSLQRARVLGRVVDLERSAGPETCSGEPDVPADSGSPAKPGPGPGL